MRSDTIEFGEGFTAELRDYSYYITHPNGGGAMASLAEAALIRAIVAVRAERDALVADLTWIEATLFSGERSFTGATYSAKLMAWTQIAVLDQDDEIIAQADTLREAIAAARKQQEGATQ